MTDYHCLEKLSVILSTLVMIIGIIFDLLVRFGHSIIIVPDLRDFSLVALQIQATVSTLVVALMTLLSGMINEDVYGVSITQYYMQIRPRIIKQNRLVLSTISLIFFGVCFELINLYNLVLSVFFCEWILISFSAISLFPVFSGARNWKPEIQAYLIKNIQSTPLPDYQLIIGFLNSCKDSVNCYDWEEKYEILWISMEYLLKANQKQSFAIINTEWCDMIRAHLRHNESWIVKRGFILIRDSYDRIWSHICNCNTQDIGTSGAPEIFEALFDDIKLSLEHLSIQELEESFDFEWVFESISRVDSYYYKENPERFQVECGTIEYFFRFMVFLLAKKTTGMPLGVYNRNYWGRVLREQHINDYNVPQKSLSLYLMHRCKLYLGYTINMIKYGQFDLLKEYYLDSPLYTIYDNKYLLIYNLAIACYLFYVSELENPHLVPPRAKETADLLLASDTFQHRFTSVLTQGKWEKEMVFFQNQCKSILESLLSPYEFMNNGHAKLLVIDSAVEIFYIFVQCYISDYRYDISFDTSNCDLLKGQIIRYLQDEQRKQTKIKFEKLYQALIAPHPSVDPTKKADALFYQWEKNVLQRFKQEKIVRAVKAQKSYAENNIESILQADTKRHLVEHFRNRFGSIIQQSLDNGQEFYVDLLSFTNDTEEFLSEQSLRNIYDYLDGSLVDQLSCFLCTNKSVKVYDRSMHSDSEYLDDMKANNIKLLLGSEYDLLCKDYRNWSAVRNFLNMCKCIFISNAHVALALREDMLKIAIRDISVQMHNTSLDEDRDVRLIKETGEYRIKLINNIAATFSKDEAKQYIKNQKKVAVVGVTVAIQTYAGEIGFKITKNDNHQLKLRSSRIGTK